METLLHMDTDWMNADTGELNDVQKMIVDLYSAYLEKTKKRRVSDREMAKKLDITPATWEGYVNGTRRPSLENALKVADGFEAWLGVDARSRWLTMLGFKDYVILRDAKILLIVQNWRHLPPGAQDEILKIAKDPDYIKDTWRPGPK